MNLEVTISLHAGEIIINSLCQRHDNGVMLLVRYSTLATGIVDKYLDKADSWLKNLLIIFTGVQMLLWCLN